MPTPPPHPGSSSVAVSARMRRTRKRDNGPELAVRRRLHAAGLRYRVAYPVPGQRRRTIDIAFTRVRLAVFIDGCFWHSCPEHLQLPRANSAWWMVKLQTNQLRDLSVTAQLEGMGWAVLRFWEHEPADDVARAVARRCTALRHEVRRRRRA